MRYKRENAVAYAHEWAFKRNPSYYNFDSLGGDCTNFVSQCLFAGAGVMNYSRDVGWYFISLGNRAAAWTGVEFLHRFLTTNKKAGPYARELPLTAAQPGDIVQLSFDESTFGHSLLVVESYGGELYLASHTFDADNRKLSSYQFYKARLLHIEGVR